MEPYIQAGDVNTIDLTANEANTRDETISNTKLNGGSGAEMIGQWGTNTAAVDQLKAECEESGEDAKENQGRG